MIILGNFFGLLSVVLLGMSVHKKEKRGMLVYQIFDCLCAIISCLCLGGYSGCISNSVSLIRNILEYKSKITKRVIGMLVTVTLLTGIYNIIYIEETWLGIIPLVASIEYTLGLVLCKSYNKCKITLFINLVLWGIYYVSIFNVVSAILMVILSINTIYTVYMANMEFSDNGMTKFQREKLKKDFESIRTR